MTTPHRWYIKSSIQLDHEARAAALGCPYICESTTPVADRTKPFPQVVVQTRLGRNFVFPEPVTKAELDAVSNEPKTATEVASDAVQVSSQAAGARLKALNFTAMDLTEQGQALHDLLRYLGIRTD